MIKIIVGKNGKKLSLIAENHWTLLNPTYKPKNKVYQKAGALAGRIRAHAEKKSSAGLANEAAFFNEFCKHDFALLKGCIKAPASSFRALIDYVEGLLEEYQLSNEDARNATMSEILTIFNYQPWRSDGGGYDFFVELGIKTCAYCNLEDLKDDEEKKKFIGTYDHYYDKALYPYLSLAIGNLIPSCYACNQTYKKTFFCTVSHIHPHIDNYNELCVMQSDYAGDMDVTHKVWIKPSSELDDRRLAFDNALHLDRRYNDQAVLKQVVLIRSTIDLHPPERISEVSKDLGISVEDTVKSICKKFDLPYYSHEILNTVYGKLKRDIAVQYHLIDNP